MYLSILSTYIQAKKVCADIDFGMGTFSCQTTCRSQVRS